MTEPRFREVQRFRQDWLWALLIFSSLPAYILVVVVVVDDAGGLGPDVYPTLAGVTVLVWGPLVVFYRAALVTEVRSDGLYLKLWPLHLSFRRVACGDMSTYETVSFSPMGDFGGIGVRHNPTLYRWGVSFDGPKAYVASGGDGVQIERVSARPLIVGTQRPTELQAALERTCGDGTRVDR
jgi:hypothetical protein